MDEYEFDERQKRQIDEQIVTLVEDMQQLLLGTKDSSEIYLGTLRTTIFPNFKKKYWQLVVSARGNEYDLQYGFVSIFGIFYIYKEYHISSVCNNPNVDTNSLYAAKTIFINNYKKIRKRIIKSVNKKNKKEAKKKKQDVKTSEQIDEILVKKKFQTPSAEAKVHFQYPDSMNVHELEMREEVGRKIGRIDFGDMIVEIITSGDIVIANKDNVEKRSKRKEKR